jgi:oligopeptide/dipeptide ABC transporter ATP-binding protein
LIATTKPENSAPVLFETQALEGRGLVKTYSKPGLLRRTAVRAVDHVSVAVIAGTTVALVGESGCGKSSLARLLLDLEEPDAGSVCVDGRPVSAMDRSEKRAYRRAVQMVFQHPQESFNPMLTIGSSLRDALRLRDNLATKHKDALVKELFITVGLDPAIGDRRRRELSGGELQRAALARALASEPTFLVLDEPTSALDASVRGQIVELLIRLQASSALGYLLITHDMRLVQMMADFVRVMYLGQIVEEGPPAVLRDALHPYTQSLIHAAFLEETRAGSAVHGEVAQLPEDYRGCRFYQRCTFARDGCLQPQALEEAKPGHQVRCWRWQEIKEQRGVPRKSP